MALKSARPATARRRFLRCPQPSIRMSFLTPSKRWRAPRIVERTVKTPTLSYPTADSRSTNIRSSRKTSYPRNRQRGKRKKRAISACSKVRPILKTTFASTVWSLTRMRGAITWRSAKCLPIAKSAIPSFICASLLTTFSLSVRSHTCSDPVRSAASPSRSARSTSTSQRTPARRSSG
jgi:hypothetical protein